MERTDILKTITSKLSELTENQDLRLAESTTPDEVENWDSLSHIQLVVALEKHYKIRFNSKEILEWKNVGEIIDSVVMKNQHN
jgi:acyl carrier protein